MKDTREVVILNLDDILPNRFQPRIKFDEKAIVELSESIKQHGVIQPIIVRKISDKYEIIAGERRYKASVMAGKTSIPAIVVDLDDKDSSEIALIENVQRQDLTPIEEAISYRKILDMGYLTQEELASKLGVAQPTIANKLRLLNLDDEVQDALLEEKISERHARSLLKLQKASMQREMLNRIITERLTVRKTDEEIEKMINNDEKTATFDSLENNMNNFTENTVQNVQPTDNSANPFMINNNVVSQPIVNDEPVNIVPENIEVLDFNEFNVNNEINSSPVENDINIPSMPIVNDDLSQSNLNEQNIEYVDNYNNSEVTYIPQEEPFVSMIPGENINSVEDTQPIENINESIQPQVENSENLIQENSQFEQNPVNFVQNTEEEPVELHSNKFFNILNNEEESDESADEQNEIPLINNNEQTQLGFNETSNIFNQPVDNNYDFQPLKVDEQIPNFNENISSSIPQDEIIYNSIDNQIMNNSFVNSMPTMNLRDAINMVRNCADNIEKNNFEIDCEEFDFDDIYQIIFKIKK